MIIDLALIRRRGKPLRIEREFRVEELELQSEILRLEEPARVAAEIQVSGERARISGRLEAEIELTCCRCLSTFRQSLNEEFRLEYQPDREADPGHDEALNYSDLEIGFYHQDQLDLSPVVGEQILLGIPMNPVCRPDCRGLCDQCGQNLNEERCDCVRRAPDPRLFVLEELKKKLR